MLRFGLGALAHRVALNALCAAGVLAIATSATGQSRAATGADVPSPGGPVTPLGPAPAPPPQQVDTLRDSGVGPLPDVDQTVTLGQLGYGPIVFSPAQFRLNALVKVISTTPVVGLVIRLPSDAAQGPTSVAGRFG